MSVRSFRPRPTWRRAAIAAVTGVALTLLATAPAGAAQPQPGSSGADAGGLVPLLFGAPFIFPPVEARNPGDIHPYTLAGNGAISTGDLPDFPGDFGAGLLGQLAIAYPSTPLPENAPLPQSAFGNDLVSAACAGLIEPNGTISLGDTGDCDTQNADQSGIVLDAGPIGLRGNAITASCTVDKEGYWESFASFADVQIVTPGIPPFIPDIPIFEIPLNPTRNFGPDIGLARIVLHKVRIVGERDPLTGQLTALGEAVDGAVPQYGQPLPEGAAGIDVDAGEISVLDTGFKFGHTVCYREAAAADPDIPLIPLESMPIAGGGVLAVLGGALAIRRRKDGPVTAGPTIG